MAQPYDHVEMQLVPTPPTESISSADIDAESAYTTSPQPLSSTTDTTAYSSTSFASHRSDMAEASTAIEAESACMTANESTVNDDCAQPPTALISRLAPPTQSISKKLTTTFFDLPRELRDEIYGLAFCEGPKVVGIVPYASWYNLEVNRRHALLQPAYANNPSTTLTKRPRPFFDMIVSKQFFEEASKAWAHHKTINLANLSSIGYYGSSEYGHSGSTDKWPSTMHKAKAVWGNRLYLPNGPINKLAQYATLEKMEVTIDPQLAINFDLQTQKFAFKDTYTKKDFDDMGIVQVAKKLHSLKSMKLIAGPSDFAETAQEQARWEENVAALQDYIQKLLMERQTNPVETETQPDTGSREGQDGDEYEMQCYHGRFAHDEGHHQLAKLALVMACIAIVMGGLGPLLISVLFLQAR